MVMIVQPAVLLLHGKEESQINAKTQQKSAISVSAAVPVLRFRSKLDFSDGEISDCGIMGGASSAVLSLLSGQHTETQWHKRPFLFIATATEIG